MTAELGRMHTRFHLQCAVHETKKGTSRSENVLKKGKVLEGMKYESRNEATGSRRVQLGTVGKWSQKREGKSTKAN